MDASRATTRRGGLPAGVLGMLALMAAVEGFVTRHELDVVPPADWQYLLARRAAGDVSGCDLLILGDSQAKLGVLPRVVGARGGLRAYNLAISGAPAPASYDVLRRALRGGARPAAVVVDFHPLLLAVPPRANRAGLPFLLGFGAALRLGWDARDPALQAGLVVQRALPSLRCRPSLRSWALWAAEGRANPYRRLTPEVLDHWAQNDGAWVLPTSADRAGTGLTHFPRAYHPGWTPDRVNADYLRRFLRLAGASGVPVYWLIPPVHPALQAANAASGFDARYVGFVRRVQDQFPGLVVLDGRHAGYDPGVFVNPDHLGREGAFALSEDLGDLLPRLARATPPDRWVTLPRYRPRATDPRVIAARPAALALESAPTVTR